MFFFKDLDVIFGNILEIQEFTAKFISSLEDCLEMAEEGSQPLVGPIFEEMVEVGTLFYFLVVK